jgi:cytochrome P450
VLDDPGPFLDRLRADAPVWQLPGQDTFLVSDPALIREAVGRPEDFSSNLVSVLHDDGGGCPVAFPMAPHGDPIHVLATADPPVHTRHRKLLQAHLSPAAVAGLEPAISSIVDEQIATLLDEERADAVATFSDPVPARTVCELVGLPAEDASQIITLVSRTGALLDGVTDLGGMGRAAQAALEFTDLVRTRLDEALARPPGGRSGLLAVFADDLERGEITHGEVRDMLVVLVSAGSETTASLLATAVEALARRPDLQERLRRHPGEIPDRVEALLRADGPFQFHYRWTTRPTVLGITAIPAHSRVLLMWAAANRPAPGAAAAPDDAVITDDGAPNTGRAAPHFAFGRGLHFCIGAPVARLEARIALERLLARTASIVPDPERPPTRRPSIFIRRHATLPVLVRAA